MALRVRCKECQEENPMGDLFCRKCGAEIDINNLTPDQIVQEKKTGQLRKIIDTVSCIIVLIGLILSIIIMVPLPGTGVPELGKADTKMVEDAVNGIKGGFDKSSPVKTFMVDPLLAGAIYHKLMFEDCFSEKAEIGMITDITPDGEVNMTLIMKTLMYGFPLRAVIHGKLEQSNQNDYYHWPVARNTTFKVTSTWVGLIPFTSLGAVVIRNIFMDFLNSTSGRDIISKVDYIKVSSEKKFFYVRLVGQEGTGKKK